MKVTIYGIGCPRCEKTAEVVKQALAEANIPCELEKVTDYAEIAKAGIMATPSVALDGKVVSSGKLPTVEEIKGWL